VADKPSEQWNFTRFRWSSALCENLHFR
jgi:hypothetical protein